MVLNTSFKVSNCLSLSPREIDVFIFGTFSQENDQKNLNSQYFVIFSPNLDTIGALCVQKYLLPYIAIYW